jgi:pimeloyl-ACP methyl ester carboxylesterase
MDSLGEQEVPQDVVVLGHSMGGTVASEMASTEKGGEDRIGGIVRIGPVNPNPGAAEAFRKRIEVVSQSLKSPLLACRSSSMV